MKLNPRVNPIATPAKGAILKSLDLVVANTTYTRVNAMTVSKINALIAFPSLGGTTLGAISLPNIEYTTAAPITAPNNLARNSQCRYLSTHFLDTRNAIVTAGLSEFPERALIAYTNAVKTNMN